MLRIASCLLFVVFAACGGSDAPTGPSTPTTPTQPATPVATSIALSSGSLSLASLGATGQITATVRDQNGASMAGAAVTWSSSNAQVATVSTSGLVSAVANGTATVTAQSGAASGTASVTVQQVAASVALSSTAGTLAFVGDTLRLSATVADAGGSPVEGATVVWASSDTQVVTVSDAGLVTATGNGTATVTATSGAATGSASLKVEQTAASIVISPTDLNLSFPGENVRLSAVATDGAGNALDASAAVWASSNPAVATVSATGIVSSVANGTTTISATLGATVGSVQATVQIQTAGHAANRASVPMGGNTWMIDGDGFESVAEAGVLGWSKVGSTARTYIRVNQPGTFIVSVTTAAPAAVAELELSIGETKRLLLVGGGQTTEYLGGQFTITQPGYVSVDLKGLARGGDDFGTPSLINVSGTAVTADMNYVKHNDGGMFYFGRRGPSTHLLWNTPAGMNVKWMYSEITVPVGQDVEGSYFMANGFTNGYFGVQNPGPGQRQFLFSIWSPFQTDDPSTIPDDQKVKTVRTGEGVVIGEFGNEGSGGQSRLPFDWKAGSTYGFLTKFEPQGDGTTDYTAWVFLPETQEWKLIATFKRPLTDSYATGTYSFLENFLPDQGNITRSAFYENQWVADEAGSWQEVTDLTFSVDGTGNQGFRKDFTGGISGGKPFLRIDGFFNDFGIPGTIFTRTPSDGPPAIDFTKLP